MVAGLDDVLDFRAEIEKNLGKIIFKVDMKIFNQVCTFQKTFGEGVQPKIL
jgi:hypothetical protein